MEYHGIALFGNHGKHFGNLPWDIMALPYLATMVNILDIYHGILWHCPIWQPW